MAFFDPRRPSYRDDPYPALERLRREEPVHWSRTFHAWVTTRFVDCSLVLHDSARFTTDPTLTDGDVAAQIRADRANAPLGAVPSLGTSSGAEHRRLRSIVNPLFTPTSVRKAAGVVATLVDELLDDVPTGEPFDFMTAFANPLPKEVMLAVMGFPPDDADRFQRLLTTIEVTRSKGNATGAMLAEARAAAAELTAVMVGLGEGDLAAETVLGALVRGSGSEKLDTESIISMAAHIATVGSDPTSGALGNAIAALATHPEAIERLRGEPELMRMVTHELLRFDSPTHIALRFAAADTELAGRRIRRGDTVMAMVGAANRDPAEFPAPDDLNLDRDARRQLGFGQGEHICLGAPLALLILETALAAILRRFSRIELVSPPEFGPSVELRIPDRVMVRLG